MSFALPGQPTVGHRKEHLKLLPRTIWNQTWPLRQVNSLCNPRNIGGGEVRSFRCNCLYSDVSTLGIWEQIPSNSCQEAGWKLYMQDPQTPQNHRSIIWLTGLLKVAIERETAHNISQWENHSQCVTSWGDFWASLTSHSSVVSETCSASEAADGSPMKVVRQSIWFQALDYQFLHHHGTCVPWQPCRKQHLFPTYPSLRRKARSPPTSFTKKRSRNSERGLGLSRETWTLTSCSEPGKRDGFRGDDILGHFSCWFQNNKQQQQKIFSLQFYIPTC